MKIFIGSDHRAVAIEKKLVSILRNKGIDVETTKLVHSDIDDYPDFAFEVCHNVLNNDNSLGILICGTGIGMSIAANKVKGIRAARCTSIDDAYYSRMHNAANVLCIATTNVNDMLGIINKFIETPLASEEKHLNRINKIINFENGAYNEL